MAIDISTVRLGKGPARQDPRTIRYADLVTTTGQETEAPAQAHWGDGLEMTMLGNAQYGDCVEAEFGHYVELITDRTGKLVQPQDADALNAYSVMTGFKEDDPSTDNGTDMLAAQKFWKSAGMCGVKTDAFAALDLTKAYETEEAIAWYGGAHLGLQLPLTAQAQTGAGLMWDVVAGTGSTAGSWGGHCVLATGYNEHFLYVYTWGTLQRMSWEFLETYGDEAYVSFSSSWLESSGLAPSRLAQGTLLSRLASL